MGGLPAVPGFPGPVPEPYCSETPRRKSIRPRTVSPVVHPHRPGEAVLGEDPSTTRGGCPRRRSGDGELFNLTAEFAVRSARLVRSRLELSCPGSTFSGGRRLRSAAVGYSNRRWWRARKPSCDEGDVMFLPKLPYGHTQISLIQMSSAYTPALPTTMYPRRSLLEHQVLHADCTLQVSFPHGRWLKPSFILSASSLILLYLILANLLLMQESFWFALIHAFSP